MISVSEYCKDNILVIPEALSQMQEVVALLQDGQSAIFYKQLENDLVNVEFYTNTPCFVYIEKGEEIITTPSNETFTLGADTAFFLPQGLNLHSDHFSSKHTLTAYLLFFSETVISQYLQTQPKFTRLKSNVSSLSVFHGGAHLKSFFGSIHLLHQQGNCVSELLNIKLQEFLHLMAMHNPQHCLPALLSHLNTMTPKRNLVRLMKNPETLRLTVKDLAHLSGRSLSSFNRDFKASFQASPKQWLKEKRLSYAHDVLNQKDISVTEVALMVGYENISHFIKSFKEKYQMTPKELQMKKVT